MTVKKIGIMTWYSYENYGTALQAVALNHVICNMGYKAVDLAYDPLLGRDTHEVAHWGFFRKCAAKVKHFAGYYPLATAEKSRLFNDFIRDNIELTDSIESKARLRDYSSCFDAYVCGSDQIWSPRFFDAAYYLDFVEDSSRLVAYAPSFGCESITPYSAAGEIKKLLNRFSYIGVREASAIAIVESNRGIRPPLVVDPTLLLDEREWQGFAQPVAEHDSYCLIYFLGDSTENWKAARAIAKSRGLRIVAIPVFERDRRRAEAPSYSIGPAEFLWLISHASCVCTDSFHGMVFSTIFKRDFVAFERFDPKSTDSQNTRVYSFLEMMGAKDALIKRSEIANWQKYVEPIIDYEVVASNAACKINRSIAYLENSLALASGEKGGIV